MWRDKTASFGKIETYANFPKQQRTRGLLKRAGRLSCYRHAVAGPRILPKKPLRLEQMRTNPRRVTTTTYRYLAVKGNEKYKDTDNFL
jgi:hypothetical protein